MADHLPFMYSLQWSWTSTRRETPFFVDADCTSDTSASASLGGGLLTEPPPMWNAPAPVVMPPDPAPCATINAAVSNPTRTPMVESVDCGLEAESSDLWRKVTQNTCSRLRQTTGTMWSPSMSNPIGSHGVHMPCWRRR